VKRALSGIMLLLVMSALIVESGIQLAVAKTIVVPDSCLTIKEALSAASQGDTVLVRSGTYNEMVIVDKALSLIGENVETTFISGNRTGSVVQINADNVTVSGFTIENSRTLARNGIGLSQCNGCRISGNRFTNNWWGIAVFGCSNVNVTSNIMIDDQYGFAGDSCSNCHITKNNVTDCWDAIGIDDSSSIEIAGNDLSNNQAYGIVSDFPLSNNYLASNNITSCGCGIHLNFLSGNNETGNTVAGNTIFANRQYGIYFIRSSNTLVEGNNITNNGVGIKLSESSNNLMYYNNFINNTVEAGVFLPNVWDDGYPSGGNYWGNYVGHDIYQGPLQNISGRDGIGDTPYVIVASDADNYPLMNPYGSPPPPTYALTITASAGGTTAPLSGIYTYTANSTVPVTALSDADYQLAYWEVDAVNIGSANPYTVPMDQDHTLKAVFTACAKYTLNITASLGGTTYPAPGRYENLSGTFVSVSALPDTGYYLDNWELDGLCIGISNPNTVTMEANHTLHAAFKPLNLGHDVVTKWIASKTVVGQGYSSIIRVDLINAGSFAETINVTLYVNATSVASQNVTVESGTPATISFTWNSSGFAKGNYTISACAEPVRDEANTDNNNFTDGFVVVSIVGDLTGGSANPWDFVPDGVVDGSDLSIVAKCFGSWPAAPPPMIWNVNCDVNNDGVVDGSDLAIIAIHFGE